MSIRFLKTAMLIVQVLLLGGTAAAGGSAFIVFVKQEPPRRKPVSPREPPRTDELIKRIPPLNEFASIWRMKCCPADNVVEEVVRPVENTTDEDKVRQMLRSLFGIIGIIFNRTRPDESYAVLKLLNQNNVSQTVAPGETVSGATVKEIRPEGVLFAYSGFTVEIDMNGGGGSPFSSAVLPPGTRIQPPPGLAGPSDMAAGPGIGPDGTVTNAGQAFPNSRRINPTQWQIESREMQYISTNQSKLINEIRPVPHVGRDGKQDGVEIKQVPAKSLAASRGLEQGDIIKSINNIPVNSMDFSSISQRLGQAKVVVVQVERRGRPVTLTFTRR